MSGQWHYTEGGAQYGPVDEAEIIQLIQEGELPIGTPVLQEGHTDWQPARDHACFQVEIYPKKKRPPVQATASTASNPVSEGTSQSVGQATAQSAVTPASPVVTTVIVKEKSVLPWVLAGVACVALGLNYWLGLPEGDSDERVEVVAPPAPNIVPANTMNSIIEAAIRKAAKKPTAELTKADLEKVTKLDLGANQLTSVKGLEKLTQLTFLNLKNNKLTDVKGLEKLTNLKALALEYNQLTDVKGLEKLTNLTVLNLRINQLTDVKGLEKLTQLTGLYLAENQLTDVKGLENLTQLKFLNLDGNQLSEVTGLEKLTQLKELWLHDNPALTKAQIDELKEALPSRCKIWSSYGTK